MIAHGLARTLLLAFCLMARLCNKQSCEQTLLEPAITHTRPLHRPVQYRSTGHLEAVWVIGRRRSL